MTRRAALRAPPAARRASISTDYSGEDSATLTCRFLSGGQRGSALHLAHQGKLRSQVAIVST